MKRRSFIAALAGLPIAGLGTRMFGLPKPTAKSGITVHGPELIVVHEAYSKPRRILSLRFENVPFRKNSADPVRRMLSRLSPVFCTVNRSDWHWYGDPEHLPCLNIEMAYTMMFDRFGVTESENGLCSVVCTFTSTLDRRPWPGSHRPVDFETEILKALEGKRYRRRA